MLLLPRLTDGDGYCANNSTLPIHCLLFQLPDERAELSINRSFSFLAGGMSLHFNWSRLDETCAEALRQLINKRLAEVVERINRKNAGSTDPSHSSSPSTASQGFSASGNGIKTGAAGGGVTSGNTAPSLLVGFGSANNNNSSNNNNLTRADPSSNMSVHGSPHEVHGSVFGATELATRSPFLAASLSNNVPGATAALVGPASTGPPCSHSGGGAGTMAPGVMPQHNGGGGGPAGLCVDVSVAGPGNDEGGAYTARSPAGYGNAGTRGGANVNSGNSPVPINTSDLYTTANTGPSRGGSGGGGPSPSSAAVLREAEAGALVAEPRKVPPIVYLEVGSVEWGTTPPFVEIVAFENATDGPPGYSRAAQRGLGAVDGVTACAPLGDPRDTTLYSLSRAASTEAAVAPPATLAGCFAASAAAGPSGDGGADNNSESSHDFTVSHSATGMNTPRIVTSGGNGGHPGGLAGSIAGGAAPQTQTPVSLSQFPSQPETTDLLVSVLGYGGLHIRFHITYGGALHLSLNTAVQHEIRLGTVALRVSLPMMFYLANLDLDCYLCINVKNNVCQLWLEHGPLSSSVVNRLSITATFGGDNEADEDGVDYGASSTDFYSRFGSSSVSDDDDGEGSNGTYVNEHEVSQFVLHELRAILKETIVAPHCITIPISFGG